ncbi:hypothetical protein CBW65_22370 [Tumebacillus avium]|uniref:Uncharacterized protein n=1 Tax=Tumebacillus avium TaxID=1903704 RepID=A0A1Y0IS13_9BACL|nr:hypothetical protein [Tumebacillus avium]ARU63432.1 hypothetical protein CBW65_22370 [Tumebacillus avium]
MSAFKLIPYEVLAVIMLLLGIGMLFLMIRVEQRNRLGIFSVAFLCIGFAILLLFNVLHIFEELHGMIITLILIAFAVLMTIGFIRSYRSAPPAQRERTKALFYPFWIMLIIGAAGIGLLALLTILDVI